MAPTVEEVYFPSLEHCLKDHFLLFSWQQIYASIQDRQNGLPFGVESFLQNSECQRILKRALVPFDTPTSATRSRFDHLTAAINIAPDDSAKYNLDQLKEDAKWLSDKAQLDEVVALRICVLEWQQRPMLDLIEGPYGAGDLIDNLTGPDRSNESMFTRTMNGSHDRNSNENGTSSNSDTTQIRRAKLLLLFHSEKTYLLKTYEAFLCLDTSTNGADGTLLQELRYDLAQKAFIEGNGSAFIIQTVRALRATLEAAQGMQDMFGSLVEGDDTVQKKAIDLVLLRLVVLLDLIILVAGRSQSLLSVEAVKNYFQLMLDTRFFERLISTALQSSPPIGTALQIAVSIAAVAVLNLPRAIEFLSEELEDEGLYSAPEVRGFYLSSRESVRDLTDAFATFANSNCSGSSFALLGWFIVLCHIAKFKSATIGDQDEEAEENQQALTEPGQWRREMILSAFFAASGGDSSLDNVIALIAQSAVSDQHVFDQFTAIVSALDRSTEDQLNPVFNIECQKLLLNLSKASEPLVQYSAETLGAYLSAIGGDRSYWYLYDHLAGRLDELTEDVTATLQDDRGYLQSMLSRYPVELSPFHRLIRALLLRGNLSQTKALDFTALLHGTDSLTFRFPRDFTSYHVLGDDEVSLSVDMPLFYSRRASTNFSQRAIGNGQDTNDRAETFIPAGSVGVILDDNKPITVLFQKHFSPLKYMIGCICTVLPGNDFVETSLGTPISLDEVVDILGLLSTLLLAAHKDGSTDAPSILDESFVEAEPNKNLLEIVAELFESHLETQQTNPSDTSVLDILVHCIQFFHAVALTQPSRLWPLLARSRLLEIDGNGGSLAIVVSSIEMVTGRYDFLTSCIRLFEALVESSLQSGAASQDTKALTRFMARKAHNNRGEALPQRVAGFILTNFAKTLVEVYANSRTWRYVASQDRSDISTKLSDVFTKVLRYVYGCDDEPSLHKKTVVSALADAANLISDALLSTSPSHNLASPIIDILDDAVSQLADPDFIVFGSSSRKAAHSALVLCSVAIAVRTAKSELPSTLELRLFKAAPTFSRLFVGHQSFRSPVAKVLQGLVSSSSSHPSDPPSLLGNMGSEASRNFLACLGYLDAPFNDIQTEVDIWKMLSAVVSSRQQWFAISLLTGKVPKDRTRLRAEKESQNRSVSLFSQAISLLSEVSLLDGRPLWLRLPTELALQLLRFVACCQNHWAWAVSELRSHPRFIEAITKDYIRHLHRETSDSTLSIAHEAVVAATIAEILAMYLYSSVQYGDSQATQKFVDHLQYFDKFGVADPKYNASLHNNLRTHIAQQYKGLSLDNFKHTLIFPTKLGNDYFYDVAFASRVLQSRRSEKSIALQGLEKDIVAANEDLSVVDAQIKLIKQWKLLASELSKNVVPDQPLAAILISVVKDCLVANANSTAPQMIFNQLRFQRLELATNLLQKLVTLNFEDAEQLKRMRELFSVAWEAVRASGTDFDAAFTGQDTSYYRGLLQILFLTLKPLTRRPADSRRDPAAHAPAQAAELIEVVVFVIIKGFKSLTSALHEDASLSQPNDFVLLTAMLQVMLKIPGFDLLYSQLALHFANNNTTNHATSLFSWADQFLVEGDPVYGELAVLFLLEMSTIPAIAETLAVDGVLSQLASAKIMQFYSRARGMGPFDNPPRLHSLWSRGILPLSLNLLDAVGAPIAAEVVSFLNTFPTQLSRLCTDLANRNSIVGTRPTDSHITLGLAAEAHSLSLLWLVVERYRGAGVATGALIVDVPSLDWDKAGVKEDIDDSVLGRSNLGPLVVPANERDAELVRLKPMAPDSKAANRLEERIMADLVAASECLKGDAAN